MHGQDVFGRTHQIGVRGLMRRLAGYCSVRLLPMRSGSRPRLLFARDGATGKRIVAQWVVGLLHTDELGGLVLLRCGVFAPHPWSPFPSHFLRSGGAADSP